MALHMEYLLYTIHKNIKWIKNFDEQNFLDRNAGEYL